MSGSAKNGKPVTALMYTPAVVGKNHPIRVGFGNPDIGLTTAEAMSGSPVIGDTGN
jgi:hypothetical protein